MVYLILCVLSSTGIFLVFKYIDRYQIPSFPVIVINYLTAASLGYTLNRQAIDWSGLDGFGWIPVAVTIGILFILMFFVIAISSAKAGISITTVASKMSVVFPITFSLFIDPGDQLTVIKTTGIIAAIIGVLLTVWEPRNIAKTETRKITIPLLLFVGMGVVDSLVKFAQHRFVTNDDRALFSAVLFSVAFLTGMVILPFRKKSHRWFYRKRVWFWGILLGTCNFGSIFFMVSALNFINPKGIGVDSSIIFGANNIGIVTLSVLAGLIIFSEKLRIVNWLGIGLSMIAILLFMIA